MTSPLGSSAICGDLRGGVGAEPLGVSRLGRLPLPGQPDQRQTGPDRKSGTPYPDG